MWSNPGEARDLRPNMLEQLRAEIDRLDADLLDGFLARLELARQIGAHKRAEGQAICDPIRERQVLDQAREQTVGQCPPALVEGLVAQLIHAARLVQGRPRVAYLGPATTHSHRAVLRFFASARLLPQASLGAAITAVSTGAADYAVIPWWNRHAGPVAEVHETLREIGSELRPLCWAELAVGHVLAARPLASEGSIERLFTRPEPLAGAREWLAQRLPEVAIELVASNDEAARMAAAHPRSAAITTAAAARAWALERVAEAVDGEDNRTSFAVLGRDLARPAK
jgi:chorismate mutase/prephenate dehydratase